MAKSPMNEYQEKRAEGTGALCTFLWLLLLPLFAVAQENISEQLWGNVVLGFPQNKYMFMEVNVASKVQMMGETPWGNLSATPFIEFYPSRWVDLTLESVVGMTHQTNRVNSFEISPRIGLRLHILGSLWGYMTTGERIPLKRFMLSTFLRYEYRNLWYNRDLSDEHQSRFRVRIETKFALNHHKISVNKTWYLFADAEKYFNINKNVHERFSSKLRIRLGPGYRWTHTHRFELLMIYDFARNTIDETPGKDAVAINLRYKHYF